MSSELGYLFEKIIKDKDKAKTYFKACIYLADALKPKVFTRTEWYVRCCDAIKRFQKEVIETEESELEKEKKKVKNQIEPDLNEIKRHAENDSFSSS